MTFNYDDLRWADDGGHIYDAVDDQAEASLAKEQPTPQRIVDSRAAGFTIELADWEAEGGAVLN